MRKLVLVLALVAIAPCAARAQKVQIFGGYSYLRLDNNSNLNGWELSGTVKGRWLGLTADFSGDYGSPFGPSTSLHTFLFGPQLSIPFPIFSPFVHALVGGARLASGGISDTALATAVGGGIDAHIAPFFSYRLFQLDYLGTRFGGSTQNNLRLSTGLVFHF
jgi:hypothetical protein